MDLNDAVSKEELYRQEMLREQARYDALQKAIQWLQEDIRKEIAEIDEWRTLALYHAGRRAALDSVLRKLNNLRRF